jgi:arabinose-5-phosphate isomerase
MNYFEIIKDVLLVESNSLLNYSKNIDEGFIKAIELIGSISGKLIVMGVGKSGLVGSKIAATLSSTGTSSFFIHPTEAMHGDLGMISRGDAVLAISYSGQSQEILDILPHLKRFNTPLLTMTSSTKSILAKSADANISIKVDKEACPLNVAPTSSTTLTMALGDALAVCLMHKRGFKREDFASFHPGGSLGKMLFIKVKDLMRTENLPIVSKSSTLQEAIFEMTKGRVGNVLIQSRDKTLYGVLSDGDIRRALMKEEFSLNHQVDIYASKSPIVIDNDSMLASEALKIIESKKIQLLVVVDEVNRIKGLLHIHDLVEAGIE